MATVDLNYVQFWAPPSNPFLYKQRTTSSQSTGRPTCTNSSRNRSAPLHKTDRILKRNDQSKSAITAAQHQGDDFAAGAQVAGRNNDFINRNDKADDGLPLIEETLGQISHRGISTGRDWNAKASLQDLDKLALDTSRSCIGPEQSRLDNSAGDSQGTRDRPVILEDDESNTPDPKAAAVSTSVDPGADSAFELSKLIDPSGHEAWYDIEDDCVVDEDLRPFPPPLEQEGLASTLTQSQPHSRYHSSGPSHDWINQHDDRHTQRTSEELGHHTLPQPLDEVGGEESEKNVSELERDMLLAFEEQVKSPSATAPSSPRPHRHSTEPLHPQIDQEHDQSRTNYGRLEKGNSSGAADGDNEEDDDDYNNDQVGDNVEGLRLAKRRQLSSPHNGPTLKRNRKVHSQLPHNGLLRSPPNPDRSRAASVPARLDRPASSRCDNQLESRKSSSPSPTVDEEPTSNAGAAYQEWPMRGFFKLITIGNEVRYGMEFGLEDVQKLCAAAFPLHTSSAGSNASFSARCTPAQPSSAYTRAGNASGATQSRSRRPRFTADEDAKLVELKEVRGWSWEDIQREFPERSTGSLQVRYSTKLKEKTMRHEKGD